MRNRPQPRTISGSVNGDGTVRTGGDFTVTRTAAGFYVVRPQGLRTVLSANANGLHSVPLFAVVAPGYTADAVSILMFNSAGAAADTPFVFTITGLPR